MVSKKSFKIQNSEPTKTKFDNNMTISCKNLKINPVFVSQKVIVSSIFDKSLIQKDVNISLPDNLSKVFNEMLADMNYINETLTKKDYSFYGCNMGYLDAEKMITEKRKNFVNFMIKNQTETSIEVNKKIKNVSGIKSIGKSLKKKSNQSKVAGKALAPIKEGKINDDDLSPEQEMVGEIEKESEVCSESNNNFRPQRKRKKPSKFKNEDTDSNLKKKSNSKNEPGFVGEKELLKEDLNNSLIVKDKKPCKIKKFNLDVIDLVETCNSSDSSSIEMQKSLNSNMDFHGDKNNANNNNSETAANKKMYFRKPVARKSSQSKSKMLKEHTLLDKILLGINCVRKWTERGLHLSRLCETDLALLNKRLTSLDCSLSDLEEHTDENNNRYLSVLLQSNLFTSFITTPSTTTSTSAQSPVQKPTNDTLSSPVSAEMPRESRDFGSATNESSDNHNISSYNRQKSKSHVPVLYRQRHGVPSILSKPVVGITSHHKKIDSNLYYMEPYANQKLEEVTFSQMKFDDQLSRCSTASGVDNTDPDIPMTASQLLRLKSKKSNAENQVNNQKIATMPVSEEENVRNGTNLGISVPMVPSVAQYGLSNNGFVSRDSLQTFILQTSNNNNCTAIPIVLLPKNTKILPGIQIQNCRPNQICIPLQKPVIQHRTVTRIQKIPLNNNGLQNAAYGIQNPHPASLSLENIDQDKNFTSKSVILKNLLQQSSSTQILSSNIASASTSKMMSLSVFQNSRPKKSFVQINPQQSFQRRGLPSK